MIDLSLPEHLGGPFNEKGGPRFGLSRVLEGAEALMLREIVQEVSDLDKRDVDVVHVCENDQALALLVEQLGFFAPDLKVLQFPAWDCVPYDRAGPRPDVVASRMATLAQLVKGKRRSPRVILTTPRALVQKLPPRSFVRSSIKILSPGQRIDRKRLLDRLAALGYMRSEMVIDKGEFAVRGGIVDLFLSGYKQPLRLDFFGDELESIRQFDVASQRTTKKINRVTLLPISEVDFSPAAIARFRKAYLEHFGTQPGDMLYEAVSEGTAFQGMEHWLSFFHEGLECLFDYVPEAFLSRGAEIDSAIAAQFEQINEHFEARRQGLEQASFGAPPYHPVPVEDMFLTRADWDERLHSIPDLVFSPHEMERGQSFDVVSSLGARAGVDFIAERRDDRVHLFSTVSKKIETYKKRGKQVVVAASSAGARERLLHLLTDAGLDSSVMVERFEDVQQLKQGQTGFVVVGLEAGFEIGPYLFLSERDILGDRLIRRRGVKKSDADVIREASSLSLGDFIVHQDHGIGRFEGLKTISAAGAPHDCLELHYHAGDKLFLPVENIELLSRFGSDNSEVMLDRLGSPAWQARKAKIAKKLLDMAEKLIEIAAKRHLRKAPRLEVSAELWDDFSARFPFEETEDQLTTIEAVRDDLGAGKPMDRLVCGDVGFGKTEVALRASFIAAMSGVQTAIVAPTTLLARQHYQSFKERFQGLPVKIGQASRLVSAKDLNAVKAGVADGSIDIVIGTHALLGKTISFRDLGLLIIDEEQHFGVQHKERLKDLKSTVHVLTLSATPIPRTLQMSLTGVRDLSLITTPPVDRLAVRSYVTPFDPVIIRDALMRERFRGGQSFFVCPRVADLDNAEEFLKTHVPEIRSVRAHGQMATGELEDVMNAFYDRRYDCLLSTSIVESGLDIPSANTMVIYRADMFGLAQLYQLRGRVGRSKTRAYAYFTTPVEKKLTPAAQKRLEVLSKLDRLGAGFTLAAHDLDLRGAGNLVGEEQSGHIREIGYELYQSMLEDAIASLKDGGNIESEWTPNIQIGTSVLIPESYVKDLQLRLSLYRRAADLETREDIEGFMAELHDRFGPPPDEVHHFLEIVHIKHLCRASGVAKIEAGPKGAVISFYQDRFANPDGLLGFVAAHPTETKLQPDHKLLFKANWGDEDKRLHGVANLIETLHKIVLEGTGAGVPLVH